MVVAAGPWSPAVAGGWDGRPPIAPVWGVNVEVALGELPRHVLEEAGVEGITATPDEVGSIFSLVTAEGSTSLGSTFLFERPEPDPIAPVLKERGARFVPALAQARIVSARVCGRPQSLDGRPLLGAAPGVDALYVAAGHGPWGSPGPRLGAARRRRAARPRDDPRGVRAGTLRRSGGARGARLEVGLEGAARQRAREQEALPCGQPRRRSASS